MNNSGRSSGPHLEAPTDSIIYEMQVRDFHDRAELWSKRTPEMYLGFTEEGTRLTDDPQIKKPRLDHLTELGVTACWKLMPVQDFENDESSRSYNWGYITSDFLFAGRHVRHQPERQQSCPRIERRWFPRPFTRAASTVIMDVVYNHTSGKSVAYVDRPGLLLPGAPP